MVRCEEFYKYFEKKGNFCGKSEMTVKKVEEYISYVKRNKIGGYKISNCALDPFINIEFVKDGIAHRIALRELKDLIKKRKILPEKITRRVSIEIINRSNIQVGEQFKLNNIPNIRSRMGEHEHEISEIGYEARDIFNALKKDIGIKNNNEAMKIMLELCVRNINDVKKIKEEIDNKEKTEERVTIVKQT